MGSKLILDEKKIVLHKYSDTPSSAQEAKQCSVELSLSQIKQIECSFKSIDFGCVTPNSVSTKSLTFFNGTNGSISIRLEGTYVRTLQSIICYFYYFVFLKNFCFIIAAEVRVFIISYPSPCTSYLQFNV